MRAPDGTLITQFEVTPRYWSQSNPPYEVDFLIQKPSVTSRHNIHPIEVKSRARYTLTSIGRFVRKYETQLAEPIVLHTGDVKVENGVIYLPLYMGGLL